MAVYDRAYRGYEGPVSPAWSRFLILPRHAYQRLFASKLFTGFFAMCFLWPIVCLVFVYLRHNLRVLEGMGISAAELFPVNARFFLVFLTVQGFLSFFLSAAIGPSLVSPDLVNNGLPLYLCRPFSRTEYVAGKGAVLAVLLSAVTWVPGLLLVLVQASMEKGWLAAHARIPGALFLSSWVWILLLSVASMAISAHVRRAMLARLVLILLFFMSAGLAAAVNDVLDTRWGFLLCPLELIRTVWLGLLEPGLLTQLAELPLWSAWAGLGVLCGICLLLLRRRLRAYEVVR